LFNRPRSIYQHFNMAPRLLGQTSMFGGVFFVSKSLLGIERQRKLKKFAILSRKPRIDVRILIYRTWPIGPFLSCLLPLCQNESYCETIHMKMCSAYRFIFTKIELIFIRKVLHEASFWNRGTRVICVTLRYVIGARHFALTTPLATLYDNAEKRFQFFFFNIFSILNHSCSFMVYHCLLGVFLS